MTGIASKKLAREVAVYLLGAFAWSWGSFLLLINIVELKPVNYFPDWGWGLMMWGPAIATGCLVGGKKFPSYSETKLPFGLVVSISLTVLLFVISYQQEFNSSAAHTIKAACFSGGSLLLRCLGEEIGWRRYLDALLVPLGRAPRFFFVGFVWQLWHFPEEYLFSFVTSPFNWVLALFSSIVLSIVFGEVCQRYNSVYLPSVLHAIYDRTFATQVVDIILLSGYFLVGLWGLLRFGQIVSLAQRGVSFRVAFRQVFLSKHGEAK